MSNRSRSNRYRSTHDLASDIASVSTTSDPDQPLIQRTGQGILIPIGADLGAVISELAAIESDRTSGSEVIDIETNMGVPPWEGAQALATAIQRTFGILRQLPDRHGRREQLRIEISNNKTVQIPWGFFDLPGLNGHAVTSSGISGGQSIFCVSFKVQRRHESRVESLIHLMRQIAGSQCLHRGQAFSVTFRNAEGKLLDMAVPVFFPLSDEQPVFNQLLTESIERNILVPLMYADELSKKGFSLKRGVLFAGTYGVGKTLLATYIAKMAIDAKWTFIYVKNSSELPDALRFAMRYQPVVIFGEDIDRVAGIDRTDKVNELLNQLDGVDGKTVRMLTILTTNHPEKINAAMMRPGRIDLVLKIDPPDAATVERMLATFGADNLANGIDLSEAARLLAGQSPARIREMLQRSTLEVLRRTGDITAKAVTADLVAMAEEVIAENPSSAAPPAKPLMNGDGSHLETPAN